MESEKRSKSSSISSSPKSRKSKIIKKSTTDNDLSKKSSIKEESNDDNWKSSVSDDKKLDNDPSSNYTKKTPESVLKIDLKSSQEDISTKRELLK